MGADCHQQQEAEEKDGVCPLYENTTVEFRCAAKRLTARSSLPAPTTMAASSIRSRKSRAKKEDTVYYPLESLAKQLAEEKYPLVLPGIAGSSRASVYRRRLAFEKSFIQQVMETNPVTTQGGHTFYYGYMDDVWNDMSHQERMQTIAQWNQERQQEQARPERQQEQAPRERGLLYAFGLRGYTLQKYGFLSQSQTGGGNQNQAMTVDTRQGLLGTTNLFGDNTGTPLPAPANMIQQLPTPVPGTSAAMSAAAAAATTPNHLFSPPNQPFSPPAAPNPVATAATAAYGLNNMSWILKITNMSHQASSPDTLSSSSPSLVPYYVLEKPTGRTQVLFLVPTALVQRLTAYPILCRGATFLLRLEDSSSDSNKDRLDTDMTFLAVYFTSPVADELAKEIAIRLTRRLEDAQNELLTNNNNMSSSAEGTTPFHDNWLGL